MKKLFSKTVAALLSVTCMGSVMTASFNGRPLFTPKLIAEASSGVSFDEETGVLTLYGNIENMFALANYSGDKRVKEVKALKGTVLPADCTKLFCRLEAEKIDISNADTSHVTNMSDMFSCCSNLKYLNIDNIDTSNVTNMNQTFYACPNLKSINLQSFNTSNVTDMMNMFNQCSSLETLDLSGFDTSSVTTMACMFSCCTNLSSIDMSTWNTCNLEYMNGMFQGCQNLKSLDFKSFNPNELKSFNYVFSGCEKLEKIRFCDFNTSKITNMDYLFYRCSSIPLLDLSSFDTSNVTSMQHMFDDCQSLEKIYVSDKWTTASLDFSHWTSIEYDRFMFFSCKNLKGGNGTGYEFNKTRSIMACIDTKETPGYLTNKDDMDIKTLIDLYGCDHLYNNMLYYQRDTKYFLGALDNIEKKGYYDITSYDNIALEVYKKMRDDYQRIEEMVGYANTYYLENNNTYIIKAYQTKIDPIVNIWGAITFNVSPHVDRINESQKPMMWVSNEASNKQSAFNNDNSAIVYLPPDTVKGFHKAAYCDKNLKQQSELDVKTVSVIYAGINQSIAEIADDLFEFSPAAVLGAMLVEVFKLDTIDNVNVWKYIDEYAIIESNEYENGIKITRKGNDTMPKSVDDIYIEAWYGDIMEGQEGNVGHFIPFQYSDIINHK